MELEVLRYSDNGESTLGLLFVNGVFHCYTLEDEKRTEKVFGETRIPEGTYKMELRKEGGHHTRYAAKYPQIHKGMLHILDVPNFQYILIHIGNNDDDTAGCLLVGNLPNNNQVVSHGSIGESAKAYVRLYSLVSNAIQNGEAVTITYKDHSNL